MINIAVSADGTELTATISVIGEDGDHIDPDDWPISNDPGIVLSSHPSASKTVTKIDEGVFTAFWTGLSPALTHLQIVRVSVDVDIDTKAWSTYVKTHQVILPAVPGDEMDLIDAPNATAVGAIQAGLSTFDHTANSVTVGTNSDKSGYSLSAAGVLAIWHQLTSGIEGMGSIGKLIIDRVATLLRLNGMIEDVDGERFTTKALQQAPSGSTAVTISPTAPSASGDAPRGTNLFAYVNEGKTFVFAIVDRDGEPVNLSGATLEFAVDDAGKNQVFTVDGAGITVGGQENNQVSVTVLPAYHAASTSYHRPHVYALRDRANVDIVHATGQYRVVHAPGPR
jgi:hypothetical protein